MSTRLWRRKQPWLVEAHPFHAASAWPAGVCCCTQVRNSVHIHTEPGVMLVAEGDWIVTDQDGTRSVHTRASFEASYEPAA